MAPSEVRCREFRIGDVERVLVLMRGLAELEGYADDFRVTARALRDAAFGDNPPFRVFVAYMNGQAISGIAVTYIQPWTYHLAPTLVLKELFVDPDIRQSGIGTQLFKAVIAYAHDIQAFDLKWTVLADNTAAQRFYQRQGSSLDAQWINWTKRIAP